MRERRSKQIEDTRQTSADRKDSKIEDTRQVKEQELQ